MNINSDNTNNNQPPIPLVAVGNAGSEAETQELDISTPNALKTPSKSAENPPPDDDFTVLSPHRKNLKFLPFRDKQFENRYDTDDGLGPFYDAVEDEGPQLFNELQVPVQKISGINIANIRTFQPPTNNNATPPTDLELVPPPPPPNAPEQAPAPAILNEHVPISEEMLGTMKKTDIQYELRICMQPHVGNKGVLLERLKGALEKKLPVARELNNKKMRANLQVLLD